VFIQYIEDNTDREINRSGAPKNGVKLDEESGWIMTPVIEYKQQAAIGKNGVKVRPARGLAEKHIPPHRIIFENLHTEDSPFVALSMANQNLKGVYDALKAGKPADAEKEFANWLKLPPERR